MSASVPDMTLFTEFLALAFSAFFPVQSAPELVQLEVAGESRSFLIAHQKPGDQPAPVVFAFHGKGGNGRAQRAKFDIDRQWPEAIVLYPNGLKRKAPLYDPRGEKSGWTVEANEENQDIKFFDAMLAWLRTNRKIDESRITVTGHSNGGFFSYVLGATRGKVLAGIAPSSATGARFASQIDGLPLFHLAGKQDELVSYRMQSLTINSILNQRNLSDTKPQVEGQTSRYGTGPNRVVLYVHEGGHTPPKEGVPPLVEFLKSCKKG